MTVLKNTEWPTSFETCEQVGQKIIAVEKATDGQTANLGNELLAAYQECLKEDPEFHVEKFKQAMASVLGFPYKYKGEKHEGTRTQKSMLESSPYLKTYFHAMKTAESAFKGDNSGEKKAIAQSKAANLSSLSDATTMQSVRHASEAVAKYRKAEKKKAAKLADDSPLGQAYADLTLARDKCAELLKDGHLTEADIVEVVERATDAFNRAANKGLKAQEKANAKAEKEAEKQKAATQKAASEAATKRHAKPKAKAKQAA